MGSVAIEEGALFVAGGQIRLGRAANAINLSDGTVLGFTTDVTLALLRELIIATGATATIDTDVNLVTVNGVIAGAGSLIKAGGGDLVLHGTDTYSGDTTLAQGTLYIDTPANLGGGSIFVEMGRLVEAGYVVRDPSSLSLSTLGLRGSRFSPSFLSGSGGLTLYHIDLGSVHKGETSGTITETISGSNGWVLADSWVDAVIMVADGFAANVAAPHTDHYTIDESHFDIDTLGNLAARYGSQFSTSYFKNPNGSAMTSDTPLVVFEDWTDNDYDDWYWTVTAEEVDTKGTVNVGYMGDSSTFTVGQVNWQEATGTTNEYIVPPEISFESVINWGDGTSSVGDATSNGEGGYLLSGDHSYAHEGPYVVVSELIDTSSAGGPFPITFTEGYIDVRNGVDRSKLEADNGHSFSDGVLSTFDVTSDVDLDGGTFSLDASSTDASYWFNQSISHTNGSAELDESDGTISVSLTAEGSFDTAPSSVTTDAFVLSDYSVTAEADSTLDTSDSWVNINGSHTIAEEGALSAFDDKYFDGDANTYSWHHEDSSSSMTVTGDGQALSRMFIDGMAREDSAQWNWDILHEYLSGTFTLTGSDSNSRTIDDTGDYSAGTWDQEIYSESSGTLTETGSAGDMDFDQTFDTFNSVSASVLGDDTAGTYGVTATSTSSTDQIQNVYDEEMTTSMDDGFTDVTVRLDFSVDVSTGHADIDTYATAAYSGDTFQTDGDFTQSTNLMSSDTYSDENSADLGGDYVLDGETTNSTTLTSSSTDDSKTTNSLETSTYDETITDQDGPFLGDVDVVFESTGTFTDSGSTTVVNPDSLSHSTWSTTGSFAKSQGFDSGSGDFVDDGNDASNTTTTSNSSDEAKASNGHSTSTSSDTYDNSGNNYDGSYDNTGTSTASSSSISTMTETDYAAHSTDSDTSTSSYSETGDSFSGDYTQTGADNGTSSETYNSTDEGQVSNGHSTSTYNDTSGEHGNNYEGTSDSTGTSTASDSSASTMTETDYVGHSTDSDTSTSSYSETGDSFSGDYTSTSADNGTSSDTSDSTDQGQISDSHSTSTYNDTSHDVTNTYNGTDSSTGTSTATDSSASTMTDTDYVAHSTDSDTSTSSNTATGDYFSGEYTQTGADNGTSSETYDSTDQGQVSSGHSTSTYNDTNHDVTNTYDGTDSSTGTSTATDSSASTMTETDYSAHSTDSDTSTNSYTATGDYFSGDYTQTSADNGTSSETYDSTDQGQISSGHSTSSYNDTENDVTNVYSGTYSSTGTSTGTDSSTSTMTETDYVAHATDSDSSTSSYTETGNYFSGDYTQTSVPTTAPTATPAIRQMKAANLQRPLHVHVQRHGPQRDQHV